jgi:hypothetical protein
VQIGFCRTCVVAFVLMGSRGMSAQQLQYLSGQSIAPFFDGWETNADGSFNMVFGYLNRNYREELNIPLGPTNRIEPAALDQTQPTYFYPRRHRLLFRVRVPKEWGKKDVVWTVTANGKTEKAVGYLLPQLAINNQVISENRGGGSAEDNQPPSIALEGSPTRSIGTDETLSITVKVSDDGIPKRRAAPPPLSVSDQPGVGVDVDGSGRRLVANGRFARMNATGLRVAWIQWRGPGKVTFEPWYMEGVDDHMPGFVVPEPSPDGRVVTSMRFSEPGTYVIRAMADDGALYTPMDVKVIVAPGSTPKPRSESGLR